MIYILEETNESIIDACGGIVLANIISIAKRILDLIQLVGPIIALVSLTICFIKLMTNPDDKKLKAGLKNSLIALVILFLVPFMVNLTMSLVDDTFSLAKCWNNAEEVASFDNDNTYVDTSEKPKQNIVGTQDSE